MGIREERENLLFTNQFNSITDIINVLATTYNKYLVICTSNNDYTPYDGRVYKLNYCLDDARIKSIREQIAKGAELKYTQINLDCKEFCNIDSNTLVTPTTLTFNYNIQNLRFATEGEILSTCFADVYKEEKLKSQFNNLNRNLELLESKFKRQVIL